MTFVRTKTIFLFHVYSLQTCRPMFIFDVDGIILDVDNRLNLLLPLLNSVLTVVINAPIHTHLFTKEIITCFGKGRIYSVSV